MSKLIVVDFQYLYYKYKGGLDSPYSKMKRLTDDNGVDISYIYYPLRELMQLTENGEVDSVICFDDKSNDRKEEDSTYKANRKCGLGSEDFININTIYNIMTKLGHTTLRGDGKEADDYVNTAVRDNKHNYEEIEVYTVDSDILQLVTKGVAVNLFKQRRGYIRITENNFEETLYNEKLFKGIYLPYNYVALYKCTVGDTSDGIKGVPGYGPKAFEKMVETLGDLRFEGTDCDKVKQILEKEFSGAKLDSAIDSLDTVMLRYADVDSTPRKANNLDIRTEILSEYNFKSLI